MALSPLKVVFAGTPGFALPSLRTLLGSEHEILAVYTQPDRGAGRGRKIQPSPVKQYALNQNIAIRQPLTLKDGAHALQALSPDLMVVVAYGLLLPGNILDIPRFGCINVHASLLPRWRGAAPIQRAILSGDPVTGISIMQMDIGLDTGDILLQKDCEIAPADTGGTLHDKLAVLGANALLEVINDLAQKISDARAQRPVDATYAQKLAKAEAQINWSNDAVQIDRQIRAYNPWPVAFTHWEGKVLRIWKAHRVGGSSIARPGTVVRSAADGIDVATGASIIRLKQLQLAGKNIVESKDFANAHHLEGVVLQ
jgi:methionyl-tRNA formyltransferase